jgi:hypothetical protein
VALITQKEKVACWCTYARSSRALDFCRVSAAGFRPGTTILKSSYIRARSKFNAKRITMSCKDIIKKGQVVIQCIETTNTGNIDDPYI